jgi:heptosyltransferase-1
MRILFVKTSSLGDVLHQCPAVSDAHARYPNATIDWVVEDSFAGVAEMHPAVRRVIPIGIRRWRTRIARPAVWAEMLGVRRTLRDEAYDLVVDTQGLLKSAIVASQALGTKHGYDASSARESVASRFYDVRHHVPREMHAVARNRALVAAALGKKPDATCSYGLRTPADLPLQLRTPYCVMLSMTSRADKLWPESHWVALVREVAAMGLEIVLPWGSDAERARCERIAENASAGMVPRRMSLGELASLIAGSRAVVGVDTGLTHFGAALEIPAIGLYCASDPRLTGLYGSGPLKNIGGPGRIPTPDEALAALKAVT